MNPPATSLSGTTGASETSQTQQPHLAESASVANPPTPSMIPVCTVVYVCAHGFTVGCGLVGFSMFY